MKALGTEICRLQAHFSVKMVPDERGSHCFYQVFKLQRCVGCWGELTTEGLKKLHVTQWFQKTVGNLKVVVIAAAATAVVQGVSKKSVQFGKAKTKTVKIK